MGDVGLTGRKIIVDTYGGMARHAGGALAKVFDLRPAAIIRDLDLLRPIYAQTSAYGHFGRTDLDLPWEQVNHADDLKAVLGL